MTKPKDEEPKPPPCPVCKGHGYVSTDTEYVHDNGHKYGRMTKPCPKCRGGRGPAAVPPFIDGAKRAAGDNE